MSAEAALDTYEYKDVELSVKLPSYLRPKKGVRYFAGKSKKDQHRPLLNLAIELPNEELTRATWSTIMNAQPSAFLGVEQTVIRRGKVSFLADGLELLSSSHNSVTGKTHHDYHVLFLAGPHRVYFAFFGQGDLGEFENTCRNILTSVRVKGEPAVALSARQ